eukprot:m.244681 g.244681  ORF g.244681 m.244681 type:complete len:383 (-) comp55726_c0_seq1:114-1262(-)
MHIRLFILSLISGLKLCDFALMLSIEKKELLTQKYNYEELLTSHIQKNYDGSLALKMMSAARTATRMPIKFIRVFFQWREPDLFKEFMESQIEDENEAKKPKLALDKEDNIGEEEHRNESKKKKYRQDAAEPKSKEMMEDEEEQMDHTKQQKKKNKQASEERQNQEDGESKQRKIQRDKRKQNEKPKKHRLQNASEDEEPSSNHVNEKDVRSSTHSFPKSISNSSTRTASISSPSSLTTPPSSSKTTFNKTQPKKTEDDVHEALWLKSSVEVELKVLRSYPFECERDQQTAFMDMLQRYQLTPLATSIERAQQRQQKRESFEHSLRILQTYPFSSIKQKQEAFRKFMANQLECNPLQSTALDIINTIESNHENCNCCNSEVE